MNDARQTQVSRYFYLTPVMSVTGMSGRYAVTEAAQVVGRSERAGIILREPSISRQHARIEIRDGEVHLEDLGSKHGTFVNSRRLQARARIKPGDLIVFGLAVVVRLEQTDRPLTTPTCVPPLDTIDEPALTLTQRDLLRRIPICPDLEQVEGVAPQRDHALNLTRLGGLSLELLPRIYSRLTQLSDSVNAAVPDIEAIRASVDPLLESLTRLMALTVRIAPEPRFPVRLDQVVALAMECVARDFAARDLEVTCRVPPDLMLRLDPEQMTAVLAGLLTNAGNQSVDGTHVQVTARRDLSGIVVQIIDQGYGYPEEVVVQAFHPLGSNLADPAAIRLWEARRTVVALGGMLTVTSNEGVGATVRIVLPRIEM